MPAILEEATRIAGLGVAILPVPHGHTTPRFDWSGYQRRPPSLREIEAWLESKVGIGAICGGVSRNLVALEFTAPSAYTTWKSANPGLAARLPIIDSGGTDYVLFRTDHLTPTGSLFLPGYSGRAGRILGAGSVVPLPPTLNELGEPRIWINGLSRNDLPTFVSLDEAGVSIRELGRRTSSAAASRDEPQIHTHDPMADAADKYAHLFQCSDNYRAEPAYTERRWIVEGFLPESYLAVLAGDPKSGKSCLLTALGMAVARGEPFLGMKTNAGGVLWIAYEESPVERREALDAFPTPQPDFYITHERLYIDTPEGLDAIRWWVRNVDAKLIVIDPLYASTAAESLSDGRTARNCLSGLKDLCRTENCAAIVLHHFNKDSSGPTRERLGGSYQVVAAASMDMLLTFRDTPHGREVVLRCQGRGDFANQTWLIHSTGIADYRLVDHGKGISVESGSRDDLILGAIRDADDPISAEDVSKALGMKLGTVRNRLTSLAGRNEVASKREDATALYSLIGRD